jgi:serine/threonine protein kinase
MARTLYNEPCLAKTMSSTVAAEPESIRVEHRLSFAGRTHPMRAVGKRPAIEGAMGAVYEVERLTDSRRLALKVVSGRVAGPIATRLAREAENGARVHHSNLVSVVDVGIANGGSPFLVMEPVHGTSLEFKRARLRDAVWGLRILRQIAEAVVSAFRSDPALKARLRQGLDRMLAFYGLVADNREPTRVTIGELHASLLTRSADGGET